MKQGSEKAVAGGGRIGAGTVEILGKHLAGRDAVQEAAAEVKLATNLSDIDFNQRILDIRNEASDEEAIRRLRSGTETARSTFTDQDPREKEREAQTEFVTDQYTTFYREQMGKRKLTLLPDPNDPLSIIPQTDRGRAIQEMKNRGRWLERPIGPFRLASEEQLILPLDLTRIAELQNSPFDRHRMGVHLLQLLGCPLDLTNLDRFYASTPDGIDQDKKMIIIGHPVRPIIVRALGSTASHGLNIEQMWVIFSHLYKDAAKRQLEPAVQIQVSNPSKPTLNFEVVEKPADPAAPSETTTRPKTTAKPGWDPETVAHYPQLTRRDVQPHRTFINKATGEIVVVNTTPGNIIRYSNVENRGQERDIDRDEFLQNYVKDI